MASNKRKLQPAQRTASLDALSLYEVCQGGEVMKGALMLGSRSHSLDGTLFWGTADTPVNGSYVIAFSASVENINM